MMILMYYCHQCLVVVIVIIIIIDIIYYHIQVCLSRELHQRVTIYVFIYIYMYTNMYTYIVYIYIYTHVYIYIYIYAYIYIYIYINQVCISRELHQRVIICQFLKKKKKTTLTQPLPHPYEGVVEYPLIDIKNKNIMQFLNLLKKMLIHSSLTLRY
jgi:hypothetical protein